MDHVTSSSNSILKNIIKSFNTMLDCPARFSGEFDKQKIHCFVEYIEYYKGIKFISDEQALLELQYLLADHAYNWWMRRKENTRTWSEALTILENQYSKKRPANKVYEEILTHSYEDYNSILDFIDDKIELFAELSQPGLTEKNKSDIIYALLPNDVQRKIKLEDITSVIDLKNHLELISPFVDVVPSECRQVSAVLNSESTTEISIVLAKTTNISNSNNESKNGSNADCEKDPVIKVRRTEDLMPKNMKEGNKSRDEVMLNETKSADTNNILGSSHENFQIDSDIMNQINNIIDETEMCIESVDNNEDAAPTLSQASDSAITLELLGFQIETSKQNSTANSQSSKPLPNSRIQKIKKRCSYCRHFNHTAQVCIKKARHVKLFPERFLEIKHCQGNNSLIEANNERQSEISPSNAPINKFPILNTQTTESYVTTGNITNIGPYTNTSTDPSIAPLISNDAPEWNINSLLSMKPIPAANGKTSNKIMAAKLRSTNSPSPKCHQCGKLGYYKSICPNCSPIYNNNSHK